MANIENLEKGRATRFRSGEEAARNAGRKGGQCSGKARRKKRSMQEAAQMLLNLPVPESSETAAAMKAAGVADGDMNYQTAILVSVIQKAVEGNARAAEFLRATAGQDPQDMQRIEPWRLCGRNLPNMTGKCSAS